MKCQIKTIQKKVKVAPLITLLPRLYRYINHIKWRGRSAALSTLLPKAALGLLTVMQ